MIFTNVKRMVRGGFVNFWRNGFLSFASIIIFTLSLLVIGSLTFFSALTRTYIDEIKDKVDVNVYFSLNAQETDILALKKSLEALSEVSGIEYVSREQSLADFNERHKDDTLTLRGLEEIGNNPFPALLNIKAKDPSQYGSIAKFLESKNALSKDGTAIVETVNYNKNKLIIDRLSKIIRVIEQIGLGLSLVLIVAAVIISFNTIRITIYTARDEIAVMKLVGASNMHIRGPFVVSGMMAGFVAAVTTLVVMYPLAYYAAEVTRNFSSDFTLLSYYVSNFAQIFIIVMVSGLVLGAVSSYLAVRRYLNV